MWRRDLVIEELRVGAAQAVAPERMLRKSAAMFIAYAGAGLILSYAMLQLGLHDRWWRGVAVILALWAGHIDAASWVHTGSASTPWGRFLSKGADLASRRPYLVWLICLSPLASGLMAMEWSRVARIYIVARLVKASLLWLFGLGLASVVASILSPRRLHAIEQSSMDKRGRVGSSISYTWVNLGAAIAFWFFFCDVAGWY